jgi:hypothetical protein
LKSDYGLPHEGGQQAIGKSFISFLLMLKCAS